MEFACKWWWMSLTTQRTSERIGKSDGYWNVIIEWIPPLSIQKHLWDISDYQGLQTDRPWSRVAGFLCTSRWDQSQGLLVQVVTTNERIAEGHWEGYACWNANFLQSKLEQRVHLRMELSFPLQVIAPACLWRLGIKGWLAAHIFCFVTFISSFTSSVWQFP